MTQYETRQVREHRDAVLTIVRENPWIRTDDVWTMIRGWPLRHRNPWYDLETLRRRGLVEKRRGGAPTRGGYVEWRATP